MKLLITVAALVAAVLTVLGSRFVVPALIVCFRAIEESFAPAADNTDVLSASPPVAIAKEVKPKPRKARRRRPSAATLKAIEAIA